MRENILTMGIETSCDETAVAIVEGRHTVLSSMVSSQTAIHARYGGVVPELACRSHLETIGPMANQALAEAGATLDDIGLVAVTRGPGLVGAVLVGLSYAKSLAWGRSLPLVGVNHLEGHIMSAFIHNPGLASPSVALLVSGGHTELFWMERFGKLARLGGTRDDAAGEAFDKVAKMLGLGYPGGPVIEKLADDGIDKFDIPVGMARSNTLDFSFSGVKTAVKYLVNNLRESEEEIPVNDVCASFQRSVIKALETKTRMAVRRYGPASIIVAGGVACNSALRESMYNLGEHEKVDVVIPPPRLCTDNAAMIAAAGANLFLDNPKDEKWADYLCMDADPSWMPGEPLAAPTP